MVAQSSLLEKLRFSNGPTVNFQQSTSEEYKKNTEALIAVSESLRKSNDFSGSVRGILLTVKEIFGWAYGSYWKMDPVNKVLRFSLETGSVTPEFTKVTQEASFAEGVGLSGKTWQARKLMFVQDLGTMVDCCRRESAQRAGVKSGVCFPIILDGQVIGTMDFFATHTFDLSPEREATLSQIAEMLTDKINGLDTLNNAKATSQVLQDIEKTTSPTEVAQVALRTVKEQFDWAYGSFWTLDTEREALVFSIETGSVTPEFTQVTRDAAFEKGVGLSGRTWQKKQLMFVQDLGTMVDCCRRESAQRAGVKSGVCFPVIVEDRVIGTMDFFATETLMPSEGRLSALRNIGQMVSKRFEMLYKLEKDAENARQLAHNAEELTTFSEQLFGITQGIQEDAEQGSAMANDIAQASENVNDNTLMVASSTEEMSATISEMAQQASTASGISNQASIKSEEVKELVNSLGDSAKEINQVVEIIKNIASQTNLLALNATIEAASAGEAGKGFAVVATEVKDLAKQSADSSESIRTQVEGIQKNTEHVISSISEITDIIGNLADINATMAGAVEEQSAATQQISSSIQQSSKGTSEIKDRINTLAESSTKTAESAGEVIQAIERLRTMSAQLKNLISVTG